MADNTAFTAGSGTTFADDDIGGVKYRRSKLSLGADGSATDAVGGAGAVSSAVLRVTLASDDPAVADLDALSKAEDASHSSGDKGIMALSVRKDTAASSAGSDGDYATLNTDANGRLHVIDVSTSSVSKAEDAPHSSGDAGFMALSKRTDTAASSAGTDGDYATINTDANGRLHVIEPSCTTLAGIVYAEDAAAVDGDKGVQLLTVRKNTAAATSGTDGDYQPLVTDTNGRLHVIDVGVQALTFAEDAAHVSGDKGVQVLTKRTDTAATSAGTDGDYATLNTDANGRLHVALSELTFAEDAAHSSGDKGVMALTKRTDTAATSAGTDGDYATLNTDANGKLWVKDADAATLAAVVFAEDAASTDADKGVQVLTVRKNTAAATSGTDGDYQPFITDTNGKLWVKDSDAATLAGAVFAEDAASTNADPGVQILTVRSNSAAATSGSNGDYQPLITDTNGRLHATLSDVTYAEDAAHTSADPGVFVLSRRIDAPAASGGTSGDYCTVNQNVNGGLWVADPHINVSVTPTVSATPDYSQYDAVGGIQTLTSAAIVSGGVTQLRSLTIIDIAGQSPQFDILIFNANPAAATVTDNAAFVPSTDVGKIVARIGVVTADWQLITSGIGVANIPQDRLNQIITAVGTANLFAVVVARGAINLATTADLTFTYGFGPKV